MLLNSAVSNFSGADSPVVKSYMGTYKSCWKTDRTPRLPAWDAALRSQTSSSLGSSAPSATRSCMPVAGGVMAGVGVAGRSF
jgi:hypothetical protein